MKGIPIFLIGGILIGFSDRSNSVYGETKSPKSVKGSKSLPSETSANTKYGLLYHGEVINSSERCHYAIKQGGYNVEDVPSPLTCSSMSGWCQIGQSLNGWLEVLMYLDGQGNYYTDFGVSGFLPPGESACTFGFGCPSGYVLTSSLSYLNENNDWITSGPLSVPENDLFKGLINIPAGPSVIAKNMNNLVGSSTANGYVNITCISLYNHFTNVTKTQ